jgi:hypothetical protein
MAPSSTLKALCSPVSVVSRDAGVAVGRHRKSVSDSSRAFDGIVPKFLKQPYWDADFVSSDCLGRVYLNGTANRVGGRCRPDAA